MKQFDTSFTGKKQWPCGCWDLNGERVHHSDACIKRTKLRLERQRGLDITKRKPRKRTRLKFSSKRNGFGLTPLVYDQARKLRYQINPDEQGVQQCLEFEYDV